MLRLLGIQGTRLRLEHKMRCFVALSTSGMVFSTRRRLFVVSLWLENLCPARRRNEQTSCFRYSHGLSPNNCSPPALLLNKISSPRSIGFLDPLLILRSNNTTQYTIRTRYNITTATTETLRKNYASLETGHCWPGH